MPPATGVYRFGMLLGFVLRCSFDNIGVVECSMGSDYNDKNFIIRYFLKDVNLVECSKKGVERPQHDPTPEEMVAEMQKRFSGQDSDDGADRLESSSTDDDVSLKGLNEFENSASESDK